MPPSTHQPHPSTPNSSQCESCTSLTTQLTEKEELIQALTAAYKKLKKDTKKALKAANAGVTNGTNGATTSNAADNEAATITPPSSASTAELQHLQIALDTAQTRIHESTVRLRQLDLEIHQHLGTIDAKNKVITKLQSELRTLRKGGATSSATAQPTAASSLSGGFLGFLGGGSSVTNHAAELHTLRSSLSERDASLTLLQEQLTLALEKHVTLTRQLSETEEQSTRKLTMKEEAVKQMNQANTYTRQLLEQAEQREGRMKSEMEALKKQMEKQDSIHAKQVNELRTSLSLHTSNSSVSTKDQIEWMQQKMRYEQNLLSMQNKFHDRIGFDDRRDESLSQYDLTSHVLSSSYTHSLLTSTHTFLTSIQTTLSTLSTTFTRLFTSWRSLNEHADAKGTDEITVEMDLVELKMEQEWKVMKERWEGVKGKVEMLMKGVYDKNGESSSDLHNSSYLLTSLSSLLTCFSTLSSLQASLLSSEASSSSSGGSVGSNAMHRLHATWCEVERKCADASRSVERYGSSNLDGCSTFAVLLPAASWIEVLFRDDTSNTAVTSSRLTSSIATELISTLTSLHSSLSALQAHFVVVAHEASSSSISTTAASLSSPNDLKSLNTSLLRSFIILPKLVDTIRRDVERLQKEGKEESRREEERRRWREEGKRVEEIKSDDAPSTGVASTPSALRTLHNRSLSYLSSLRTSSTTVQTEPGIPYSLAIKHRSDLHNTQNDLSISITRYTELNTSHTTLSSQHTSLLAEHHRLLTEIEQERDHQMEMQMKSMRAEEIQKKEKRKYEEVMKKAKETQAELEQVQIRYEATMREYKQLQEQQKQQQQQSFRHSSTSFSTTASPHHEQQHQNQHLDELDYEPTSSKHAAKQMMTLEETIVAHERKVRNGNIENISTPIKSPQQRHNETSFLASSFQHPNDSEVSSPIDFDLDPDVHGQSAQEWMQQARVYEEMARKYLEERKEGDLMQENGEDDSDHPSSVFKVTYSSNNKNATPSIDSSTTASAVAAASSITSFAPPSVLSTPLRTFTSPSLQPHHHQLPLSSDFTLVSPQFIPHVSPQIGSLNTSSVNVTEEKKDDANSTDAAATSASQHYCLLPPSAVAPPTPSASASGNTSAVTTALLLSQSTSSPTLAESSAPSSSIQSRTAAPHPDLLLQQYITRHHSSTRHLLSLTRRCDELHRLLTQQSVALTRTDRICHERTRESVLARQTAAATLRRLADLQVKRSEDQVESRNLIDELGERIQSLMEQQAEKDARRRAHSGEFEA